MGLALYLSRVRSSDLLGGGGSLSNPKVSNEVPHAVVGHHSRVVGVDQLRVAKRRVEPN
jgi:hypothetical protein